MSTNFAISSPLLDSHIHLFRGGYAARYDHAFANRDEVALYEALRKVHNIERALVIGFEGEPQFQGNNRDLAAWAQAHNWITPLRYQAIAAPPLTDTELLNAFAGIALFIETPHEAGLLDAWPRSTIDQLNEDWAIVSVNAPPEALGAMFEFLARLENCFIMISHLGSPGAFREAPTQNEVLARLAPLRRLSALPHVGIKVSGLYAVSDPSHDYPHRSAHPLLNQLRDDFGAKRLFWGSDFSPCLEHVSFAQTIDALSYLGWPSEDVEAIMGANLKRILVQR